jgi:imidazolonepropionase-like amidohydrolase
MYGKASDVGSIQPGSSADIVVLDGSPLTNITATGKVIFISHKGVPVAPVPKQE